MENFQTHKIPLQKLTLIRQVLFLSEFFRSYFHNHVWVKLFKLNFRFGGFESELRRSKGEIFLTERHWKLPFLVIDPLTGSS